ncbi:MAG TPA: DUF2147 domain-containing protein [Cyclobacteriaceae bacterium]|jgi:hypothetical protein|nr:DUF2147 domain-containing protein [Cyclobacteriaceae bacterium]HRK52492.1 DUF2147 domain-containing protein [Cyclobacteriaceae bacterium]
MTLLLVFIIIMAIVLLVIFGLPGTPNYLGWKLAGIWANQSDTLQIMIHEQDACLNGHVVSADVRDNNSKIVIGKMVVNKVKLRSVWNWSTGKYIDPYTMEEFDFKIKLKGSDRLKVYYLENKNLVRREEWKLISSLNKS